MRREPWIICEHCDVVHERRPLQPREIAACTRCGATLYRNQWLDVSSMLALTLATAIAFVIANLYPIVTIENQGATNAATIWGAIVASYQSGVAPVAALSAATVFFFPLAQILLFAYVLLPLQLGLRPRDFNLAMRALKLMQPWSMVEVFLLGVLVSVVKLAGVASVITGIGLYSFAALTLLLTALTSFDLHELWEAAEQAGDGSELRA